MRAVKATKPRTAIDQERAYLAALRQDLDRLREQAAPSWEITKALCEVDYHARLVSRMEGA
jgi:hypothetical protein